jgi:cysteine-rich repeat protein
MFDETCDPPDGGGCDVDCLVLDGFVCDSYFPATNCDLACGNDVENTNIPGFFDEDCDDSTNPAACDSISCFVNEGYVCNGYGAGTCELACGNGAIESNVGPQIYLTFDEQCDQGSMNVATGDGCDDLCQIEDGYVCSGTPSVCVEACGNSVRDPSITIGDPLFTSMWPDETCDLGAAGT